MEFGRNQRCLSRSGIVWGGSWSARRGFSLKIRVPDLSNTRTSAAAPRCLLYDLLACSVADHRHCDRGSCIWSRCRPRRDCGPAPRAYREAKTSSSDAVVRSSAQISLTARQSSRPSAPVSAEADEKSSSLLDTPGRSSRFSVLPLCTGGAATRTTSSTSARRRRHVEGSAER